MPKHIRAAMTVPPHLTRAEYAVRGAAVQLGHALQAWRESGTDEPGSGIEKSGKPDRDTTSLEGRHAEFVDTLRLLRAGGGNLAAAHYALLAAQEYPAELETQRRDLLDSALWSLKVLLEENIADRQPNQADVRTALRLLVSGYARTQHGDFKQLAEQATGPRGGWFLYGQVAMDLQDAQLPEGARQRHRLATLLTRTSEERTRARVIAAALRPELTERLATSLQHFTCSMDGLLHRNGQAGRHAAAR